jgi:hypothetical protein
MADRFIAGTNLRLIEQVREGMTVIDSLGEKVGKVEGLMMGDPGAVTEQGNVDRDTGFMGDIAEVFGGEREPDVPDVARAKLLRTGYVKVDGGFLFGTDRYVQPDRIVAVRDETVYLNVPKAQLIKED